MSGPLLLVTGGARSGKSRYALGRAAAAGGPVLFVATGVATDREMAERIARHRAERPKEWTTVEARHGLAEAIRPALAGQRCVVVEDLGTLVTNLMLERSGGERLIEAEVHDLMRLRADGDLSWIVVTNEVGLGLVPSSPLGREFRDRLGLANQLVAAEADEVVLLVAGLPVQLKGGQAPPHRG